MPIWRPQPVSEEPEIELLRWSVWETDDQLRYFVGARPGNLGGRVSSAIVELDVSSRRGVTQTGRVYVLVGAPGFDSGATYTWQAWLNVNEVEPASVRDVTFEIFVRSDFH